MFAQYSPLTGAPPLRPSSGSETRKAGVHAAYVNSVAESLDARVFHIYEGLSVDGNNITALLHTDAKSEGALWVELRMRKDVKGASLNYVSKIKRGKAK